MKKQYLATFGQNFRASFTRIGKLCSANFAACAGLRLFSSRTKGGDAHAYLNHMRFDFAVSLSILLAIVFIGTMGAFLLYVPALTVFTVAGMTLGLGLMFALGLLTGTRWRRLSPFPHRTSTPIRRDLFVVR